MVEDIIAGVIFIIALFTAQIFFPWWSAVIVCAIFCYYLNLSYLQSMLIGFVSLFVMWGIVAFWHDFSNQSILSEQIGQLLGGINSQSLIAISSIIGGICGLCGALVGKSARVIGEEKTLVCD